MENAFLSISRHRLQIVVNECLKPPDGRILKRRAIPFEHGQQPTRHSRFRRQANGRANRKGESRNSKCRSIAKLFDVAGFSKSGRGFNNKYPQSIHVFMEKMLSLFERRGHAKCWRSHCSNGTDVEFVLESLKCRPPQSRV